MRVIAHPHPHGTPGGTNLRHSCRDSDLCATAALADASAAADANSVVARPLTCENIYQKPWKNWSNVAPTLQFKEDGI